MHILIIGQNKKELPLHKIAIEAILLILFEVKKAYAEIFSTSQKQNAKLLAISELFTPQVINNENTFQTVGNSSNAKTLKKINKKSTEEKTF